MDLPKSPKFYIVIWEWCVNLFKAPRRIKELHEKQKVSTEAKFCPNCDQRLKVTRVVYDSWWYKCQPCDQVFMYPTREPKKA